MLVYAYLPAAGWWDSMLCHILGCGMFPLWVKLTAYAFIHVAPGCNLGRYYRVYLSRIGRLLQHPQLASLGARWSTMDSALPIWVHSGLHATLAFPFPVLLRRSVFITLFQEGSCMVRSERQSAGLQLDCSVAIMPRRLGIELWLHKR